MKRTIPQILLLLFLVVFCLSGYFLVRHFLQMPFRATNDTLHKKESTVTLDFLIPKGTHIDDKMTIGEVMDLRFKREAAIYEKLFEGVTDLIPRKFLYLADLVLFIVWTFLFMTFLRVFTFAGYGRALRLSLLLGGITYYFMPDFTPGIVDDLCFIGIAFLIIILRASVSRRAKRRRA